MFWRSTTLPSNWWESCCCWRSFWGRQLVPGQVDSRLRNNYGVGGLYYGRHRSYGQGHIREGVSRFHTQPMGCSFNSLSTFGLEPKMTKMTKMTETCGTALEFISVSLPSKYYIGSIRACRPFFDRLINQGELWRSLFLSISGLSWDFIVHPWVNGSHAESEGMFIATSLLRDRVAQSRCGCSQRWFWNWDMNLYILRKPSSVTETTAFGSDLRCGLRDSTPNRKLKTSNNFPHRESIPLRS